MLVSEQALVELELDEEDDDEEDDDDDDDDELVQVNSQSLEWKLLSTIGNVPGSFSAGQFAL